MSLSCKHGIGVNTIDVEAARQRGIRVVYTPTTNADSVAEMTVALFLALERGIVEANINCRKSAYDKIGPKSLIGTEINGKTLGQIGMGNIAQRIAHILKNGFNCRILGYQLIVETSKIDRKSPSEELIRSVAQTLKTQSK